ncbi:MAG: glycosyltransferase family 4 protein [Vicinamibacterales bacterium]
MVAGEDWRPDPTTARPGAVVLIVPGDLATRTGGYGYDREIVRGLMELGWRVDVVSLAPGFPFPDDAARAHAVQALAALPDDTIVLADGLAFGALAEEARHEAARLRFIALVHHPLALEHGLDDDARRALTHSETAALAAARGVVVTSAATVASLAPYAVPAERIAVVLPGTAHVPLARGTRGTTPAFADAPVELLMVATLTPRKGHDILAEALGRLPRHSWRLTCAGSTTMSPPTTAAFTTAMVRHGLADRVTLAGDLDESALAAAYDRADVFVLPTRHEGYGMAVAEAVARGLPVVSTPTGAIPDLVDETSGVLVPVDDPAALAAALHRLVGDDEWRGRLAAGARARRDALPRWPEAARQMAAALVRFAAHGIVQR